MRDSTWFALNCAFYNPDRQSGKSTSTGSSNTQQQQLLEREQAWQRDHNAKVHAARERLDSINSTLNRRTSAINNAANQIIDIIEQNQREREARRELQQLEDEEEEHEQDMEQLRQEFSNQQPVLNNSAPPADPDQLRAQQEQELLRLQQERDAKARQIQSEACKTLIEAAALTGQSVDLGGDNTCSRDINAQLGPDSTYVTVGGPSPSSKPKYDPILDGSNIPTSMDFGKSATSALDQLTSAAVPSPAPSIGDTSPTSGQDASPSGGALDRLTQTIPAGDTPAPDQQPAPPPDSVGDSSNSGQSALSRLTDQAAPVINLIKEKGPEFVYDKTGEKLAEKVYEDPSQKGFGELVKEALFGPSGDEGRGFIREKGVDLLADKVFDKLNDFRYWVTTDQSKVDETPYGEQLHDLLKSIDPVNLRKGIYTYPRDMLEKLNTLLDAVMGSGK